MKSLNSIAIIVLLTLSPSFTTAADDNIVVISLKIPGEAITKKTLEKLYLKRKALWDNGTKVVPVNLPAQNPIRNLFSSKVLKRSHLELVDYWNEQHFKGISPPPVLESEEAVKIFIREVEGAIGYISSKSLEADFKVLYTVTTEK